MNKGKGKGKSKGTLESLYVDLDGKACHDEAKGSGLLRPVIIHNHQFIWMRFKWDQNVDKVVKHMREINRTRLLCISRSLGCLLLNSGSHFLLNRTLQ